MNDKTKKQVAVFNSAVELGETLRKKSRIIILEDIVYLTLPSGKTRNIGWIDGKTFHCFRNLKDFSKAMSGYGFNYELMKLGGFTDVAVLRQGQHPLYLKRVLRTWRDTILYWGSVANEQIWLRLDDFHRPADIDRSILRRADELGIPIDRILVLYRTAKEKANKLEVGTLAQAWEAMHK